MTGLYSGSTTSKSSIVCFASSMRSTMNKTRSAFRVARKRRISAAHRSVFPVPVAISRRNLRRPPRRRAGQLIDGGNLIAPQVKIVLECLEIVRPNNLALKRPGRLHIFKPHPFEVIPRGKPFDAIGVALIGALKIPKPVLAPVRKNNERGFQIFGVAARLLFCIVRVEILALSFKNAQHAA